MGSKVAESGELMTFRAALKKAHFDLMAEDDRVILIGEDVADPMGGVYKVTVGLSDAFGVERVRNTPISETAIVGTAIGSAICGYLPICEVMYFDFFTTAMDQVVNQAALLHFMSGGQIQVPIVIRFTGGAGRSSAAQHSKSLEAWFAHVPGLGVWMASTPNDAYWMLRAAVQEGNPVILFEHAQLYGGVGYVDTSRPPDDLGQPRNVRQGTDVTLVTYGVCVGIAEDAARVLSEDHGIEADVFDLRYIAPLTLEGVIESSRRTGKVVIIHEAWGPFGPGAEIAFRISSEAFDALHGPVVRVAADHIPHPFDPRREKDMLPNVDRVVSAVLDYP